jgi:hypothetical protein
VRGASTFERDALLHLEKTSLDSTSDEEAAGTRRSARRTGGVSLAALRRTRPTSPPRVGRWSAGRLRSNRRLLQHAHGDRGVPAAFASKAASVRRTPADIRTRSRRLQQSGYRAARRANVTSDVSASLWRTRCSAPSVTHPFKEEPMNRTLCICARIALPGALAALVAGCGVSDADSAFQYVNERTNYDLH